MMLIIAIIGATASGKGTNSGIIEKLWINSVRLVMSELIGEELVEAGIQPSRANKADYILSKRLICPEYLGLKTLERARSLGIERLIIDGSRTVLDTKLFQKAGALLIGVDAPFELRFQRVKERKDLLEPKSDEEIASLLRSDWYTPGESGWDIAGCLELCKPRIIDGSQSISSNYKDVLKILEQGGFELDQDVANEIRHG